MYKKISILVFICLIFLSRTFGQSKNYYIVFIGNSITRGSGLKSPETEAPPVSSIRWLKSQDRYGELNFTNQGVGGATTVDFLPATNKLFPKVIQGADLYKNQKDATLVFSMILGTNDSAIDGPNGSPVSPDSYENNLRAIIDSLINKYPGSMVVLHRPIWYSPNTYNRSRYLEEGLLRLQSYFPVLDKIIASYKTTHLKRFLPAIKEPLIISKTIQQHCSNRKKAMPEYFYYIPMKKELKNWAFSGPRLLTGV